jgi:hypothetical protein
VNHVVRDCVDTQGDLSNTAVTSTHSNEPKLNEKKTEKDISKNQDSRYDWSQF